MSKRLETLRRVLSQHGQAHLLAFADRLDARALGALLDELDAIDFDALDALIDRYVRHDTPVTVPDDLEPAPYYPYDPAGTYDAASYAARGAEIIRAGKVAAFTVAGGQGTRLGWNGPKGTFPATVVTGKPLFRVFAEQIAAAGKTYGVTIPWYIMTSPANDADTRRFFEDNNCFGLSRRNIFMFPQGTMPSIDAATGRLLLAAPGALALNPDGHGGALRALRASGALADMGARGIEHISYFQVDNPLVRIVDPLFIGLHVGAPDSSGEMSSKMVAKAGPDEKVGVFARVDGRTAVIEYSDLPPALAAARNPDGRLTFNAGSIAIHLIGVDFVERMTSDLTLPFHRALKKVPYVDERGELVEPAAANAVKLEMFIFDAIPFASSSIVYETGRVEEFAPIKNASGTDSVATSHQLQSDRAANWLESAGVTVARTADGRAAAKIEISPLTALAPADLRVADLPERIDAGAEVLL